MKRGFLGSLKKEPAGSSKIRKSTREVSIDTLQATAIDSVNHKSIDIKTTPSIDTTCEKVEKVKILILSRDKNGVLRDKEGRVRNSEPMKRGFLGSLKNEPAGSSKIRKSTREVSIDTLQATTIDSVNHKSIDINTTPSIDTTCEKVEKVKILILSHDKNGVLRDEEVWQREMNIMDLESRALEIRPHHQSTV
ncbi:hypothetical protein F2Q69_00046101 [Brassica cretica]|uniref:Uncharacterized protein n=1 Tax=Brassica cretica TaxID=69181 RepID=A0A8S9PMU0_BRACR|nr:hypothetical protein F2Q69_00046101 [Brassica cretica]